MSSLLAPARPRPVALFLWAFQETEQGKVLVYPNDDFYLGRDAQACREAWPDSTMSNKHLRIRCVVFEEDLASGIPPLIYIEDHSTNGTIISATQVDLDGGPRKYTLRNGDNAFLLTHGNCVHLSPDLSLNFQTLNPSERNSRMAEFYNTKVAEAKAFKGRYLLIPKILGAGGYGVVYLAVQHSKNRQVACKVVEPDRSSPQKATNGRTSDHETLLERELREAYVLRDIQHPNIIQLLKVFWSPRSLYIFQELITGGDLYSYIEHKGGSLHDADAAIIIFQVLKALEYLHGRNIVHRDVKPDNVLLASPDEGSRVILTDFGAARYLPDPMGPTPSAEDKQRMFSIVGTYEYAAPEIHQKNSAIPRRRGYSKAVDMWSVGSITAAALTGDVIFTNRDHPDFQTNPGKVILGLASECNLEVMNQAKHWQNVGRRPKNFIRQLLVLDEGKRLTVHQAINHPWFSNKLHASDLEAIYQRAISSWSPIRKRFKMIERLGGHDPMADRQTPRLRLPGAALSTDSISCFFQSPSFSRSPSIPSGVPSLQRREHSPLPTIAEDARESDLADDGRHFRPLDLNGPPMPDPAAEASMAGIDDSFPEGWRGTDSHDYHATEKSAKLKRRFSDISQS